MLRTTTIACVLATSLLGAGLAAADDTSPAATPVSTPETAPAPAPGPIRFTSLAPDGLRSEVDARVGFASIDDSDAAIYVLQLDAQLMTENGLGGYARVSAAKVEELSAMSSLELGGVLHTGQATSPSTLTIRAGLVLPTASNGDDDDVFLNAFATLLTRPSDLVTAAPDVTTLRVAVAPTFRGTDATFRADVGFDIPVDSERDLEPLYHADFAVGVRSGLVAGTAELSTEGSTDGDGLYHALSVGAQYDAGSATPSATLVLPFATEDGDAERFGYALLLGVSAGL